MKRWLFAPIIAGALTLIAGPHLTGVIHTSAQEPVQVRIDSIDTSSYPGLRVAVTVVDGSGRPIVGLPSEAFAAESAGESLPLMGVTTALDANVPAAVVLVWRLLTGRYPPPLAGVLATLAVFAALIALDAGIGW